MSDLTQDRLKEILSYDPETGLFTWIKTRRTDKLNTIAGFVRGSGLYEYVVIEIASKAYLAHRLAFLYMTGEFPKNDVDHKDHDGLNNKWENLREATESQNLGNRKLNVNSTSGYKGVNWDKKSSKWVVRIQVNNKSQVLGRFDKNQLESAAKCYEEAAVRLFGEFARLA